MSDAQEHRRYHCLMGALTADAASLGFHWLYDQSQILKIAPQAPEFHPIDADDYRDVPGYFAHGARHTGDLSQYGEQLWTMMKSLGDCDGTLSAKHYEQIFREHFGYGGRYVGYIDRPTRDTLDNITREETALLAQANALPFSGTQQDRNALMSKVRSYSQALSGSALRERVTMAVKQTHDEQAMHEHAFALCDLIEQAGDSHGADDQQLPAISKVPGLVAGLADGGRDGTTNHDVIDAAVRVTNNNDMAVDYATTVAHVLCAIRDGANVEDAIASARDSASAALSSCFEKVSNAHGQPTAEAVKQFGMACDLDYAVPSILHILKSSNSYQEAVRNNIYAGGDSCGRAVIIGAACGMLYGDDEVLGIPSAWTSQLADYRALSDLARQLAT